MDIRFLKDLNRHFFSRYAGKQLAFDREKVKTRLAFFLKMKKIWDRLYYSNFVNRIVYPHSSSEHKSYFDLKLTNSTENLNDFLLFNKYWNIYRELYNRDIPLWNFSGFDKEQLSLKCSWQNRTIDGFSSSTRSYMLDSFVFKNITHVISLIFYSIKLHLAWYLFLGFLALFFVFSLFYVPKSGFFDVYESWITLIWAYCWDNLNLSLNNNLVFLPDKYYHLMLWVTQFLSFPLGNGFWIVIGNYLDFFDNYIFFFKNYVFKLFFEIDCFILQLPLHIYERFANLPYVGGALAFKYVLWLVLDFFSYQTIYNLFWDWWAENSIYYTNSYFYTGVWKIFYDVLFVCYSLYLKFFKFSHDFYVFWTEGYNIFSWYVSYPLKWLNLFFSVFFEITFEVMLFFYDAFFLSKVVNIVFAFLNKLYIIYIYNIISSTVLLFVNAFCSIVGFFFWHLFEKGDVFPFVWMEYIKEYVLIWFEHLPVANVIFFRRFGILLSYNWYIYFPYITNAIPLLLSSIWFHIPSVVYLYSYTVFNFIIHVIPSLLFEPNYLHYNLSDYLFFYTRFEELFGLFFAKITVFKTFWIFWYNTIINLRVWEFINFFDFHDVYYGDSVFVFILDNFWLYDFWEIVLDTSYLYNVLNSSFYLNIGLKPYLDFYVLFKEILLFSLFSLHLPHSSLNEWIGSFLELINIFLFFDLTTYNYDFHWWSFWRTTAFFFLDERFVYILNESKVRISLINFFMWMFKDNFIQDYILYNKLYYRYSQPLSDFFFEAYWNLLDSFEIFSNNMMLLNLRHLDLNLFNNAYIAVLREFGYTLPISRQRLGSLIHLYHESLIEAGYIDYANEFTLDFYQEWTRMIGSPIIFDIGLTFELGAAMYFHYMLGNFEEEGDMEAVLPAYEWSWLFDVEKPIEPFFKVIFGDLFAYGPLSLPFRKITTYWTVVDNFSNVGYNSTSTVGLSYVYLIPTDSFENFFRFIYLYNSKELLFFNFIFDLLPFQSLFHGWFVQWRDFFVYGSGFPIGPWDVWFPLDVFFPLFDAIFEISYYCLFLLNTVGMVFDVFATGDLDSFLIFYMMFFSDIKLIPEVNVTLYFFFKTFYFFYKFSLWTLNVFTFWFMALISDIEMFFFKISKNWEFSTTDLIFFENFRGYAIDSLYHDFLHNMVWDELFAFYSFYDYYNKFVELTVIKNFDQFESLNRSGLSVFYNWYVENVMDVNLRDNFYYTSEFTLHDILPLFKIGIAFFTNLLESTSALTQYDTMTRDDSIHLYAMFNVLVESRLNGFEIQTYMEFPSIFKEFVIYHFFFEYLENVRLNSLYGFNSQFYKVSSHLFSNFASESVFLKFYNSYTHRQSGLYGLWYVFDILIFVGGCIMSFVIFMCVYGVLAVYWRRWDVWRSYMFLLYPRLINPYSKFRYSRTTDFYLYHEEIADFMFEFGDFYFQSADYIYLPYRKFNFDSFLKKPLWLFKKDNLMDFNLNAFFQWESFLTPKDLKDNSKLDFSEIQKKLYFTKNRNSVFISDFNQGFEEKTRKFFPSFDYWFKDKYSFVDDASNVSKKFVYYWILVIFAAFAIDYSFELHKFWFFNWFFLFPRTLIEYLWNTDILAFSPYFVDMFVAILGFFYCVLILMVIYYCFCWIQLTLFDMKLLTRKSTKFSYLLYFILLFNVLGSGRFWEQRILSFNFFHRHFLNFFTEEANSVKTRGNINQIFEQQTAYGWGPLINNSICLNMLVEDHFFHNDLKVTLLENHLNFEDVNLYSGLREKLPALHRDFSEIILFNNLDLNISYSLSKEQTRFFFQMDLENLELDDSTLFLFSLYQNKNIDWLHQLQMHASYSRYQKDSFCRFNFTIVDDSLHYNSQATSSTALTVNLDNLAVKLFESNWDVFVLLNNLKSYRIPTNDLSKQDVIRFIKQRTPRFNFEIKGIDWAHVLKIPIIESHIPDPEFRPDWPFGEYAPNMTDYLKNQWRLSWTFLGAGDENLVYRELLERSAAFKGYEQAWGFTDIHDFYDLSENSGLFFRKEFYDSLYNEKKQRLKFKESWVNFDINISSHNVIDDPDLTRFSDARYFQLMFLDRESTMLSSMKNYPLLEQLYRRNKGRIANYDHELVFDLAFEFGYEGLVDHDSKEK